MEAKADAGALPVAPRKLNATTLAKVFENKSVRATLGLAAFFAFWQAVTGFGFVDGFLLPSPVAVKQALWEVALDGSLWVHLGASLQRVAIGFLLACIVGLALGLVCGWWRTVSD